METAAQMFAISGGNCLFGTMISCDIIEESTWFSQFLWVGVVVKVIDIPYPTSVERLEWRRALVPFVGWYQSQATDVETRGGQKDNISSHTPKKPHPILDPGVTNVSDTLVAIWQFYSLMKWETQQNRTEGFVLRNARRKSTTRKSRFVASTFFFSSPCCCSFKNQDIRRVFFAANKPDRGELLRPKNASFYVWVLKGLKLNGLQQPQWVKGHFYLGLTVWICIKVFRKDRHFNGASKHTFTIHI